MFAIIDLCSSFFACACLAAAFLLYKEVRRVQS